MDRHHNPANSLSLPAACEAVRADLPFYWYHELSAETEARIDHHLAACPSCAQAWEEWKATFATFDAATPEPSAMLLDECRAELRQTLEFSAPPVAGFTFAQWWRQVSTGFVISPITALAGAAAMLAIGFFASETFRQQPIQQVAADQLRDARVRYVSPGADGQIRLVVEETRQRELVGRPDDQSIRGLLVRAAQDSADPGVRVETVELLTRESEASEVRNALLAVLEHDSNAGVRLKAIEGLKAYANEDSVRQALSTALLRDQDTGVRMQAIDTLMRMRGPDTVGLLQELIRHEENDYIRQRSFRALQEMNASAGTF